jgi:tRNA(Arg) A34 adenosine deaminase TadA
MTTSLDPFSGVLNDLVTDDDQYLLAAIELAWQARRHGNHPFGSLLLDAGGNVVAEAENTVVTRRDCTGHAETNLMRIASERFSPEFLQGCTLYTSTEPPDRTPCSWSWLGGIHAVARC